MNKTIQDIINNKYATKEVKIKTLELLSKDIEVAKDILSRNLKYCEDCNDYYIADSFIKKTEVKQTEVCVYQDYINSGNNEYEKRYIDVTYSICPKGHKHEIDRSSPRK